MNALIVKEDGLIYVNSIPSEPKVCMSYVFGHCRLTVCKCHDEQKAYERMMEAAESTAVLCADQEQAWKILRDAHKVNNVLQVFLEAAYPIEGLKFEVKDTWTSDPLQPTHVANLSLEEK